MAANHGAEQKIGLGWATFQVLRKTNASLSQKAGVDPKVASDQRGHGLGVNLEVYTSSDLDQKRAVLKKTRSPCASKTGTRPAVSVRHSALME